MIMRFWLLASVVLLALAWVLMVPLSPPPFQASPGTSIGGYRAAGLVPKAGEITVSEAIGHDVFEIPETDATHGAEEAATGAMPGMPGMGGNAGEHDAEAGGLRVLDGMMAHMAGRTIEIEMREWSFAPAAITVAAGEAVKLAVRNTGSVPHEFMLMPPQGMAAVAYRLERADWNLTEHEAIFERQMVMPGDAFEVVIQADRPGSWLYMCMFPYHMQFGMMGSLATEGVAPMEDMDMGGMKM
ncbi:MAG TPA: cupredoxin domain-containing protein [Kiloniellales bacterium]